MRTGLWCALSLLGATASVFADGVLLAEVTVTTDRPIYKLGESAPIKIVLKNHGPGAVDFKGGPQCVVVLNGVKIAILNNPSFSKLDPGKSITWKWNRRDVTGKPVASGSYAIGIPKWGDDLGFYPRSVWRWIAITPTGKIPGASPFPTALGNCWSYRADGWGPVEEAKMTQKMPGGYFVTRLLGNKRPVKLSGSASPILYALLDDWPMPNVGPLFRFKKPLGDTYWVSFDSELVGMRVAAVHESVVTPAGTFHGCYRLDVFGAPTLAGHLSFTFAPGVGLVRYVRSTKEGIQTFRLTAAGVKGADGVKYWIGH